MNKLILKLLFSAALLCSTTLAAGADLADTKAPAAEAPAGKAESAAPAPAPEMQLPKATPDRPAGPKQMRSKSLDLRHCLDLESNAAIIKCAGE